jgi:hypothetical protein
MSNFIFSTSSGVISKSLWSILACSATLPINSSSVSAVADHPQSDPASAQLILFAMNKICFTTIY